MVTCFISHAWANGGHDFAKRLAEALRANDVEVWLDEKELFAADPLEYEILKGVRFECDVFLFVLSPASIKSPMCRLELKEALEQRDKSGLQVIPIKFKKCRLPSELEGLLYIDFRDLSHFAESVEHLLSSIQEAGRIHTLVSQLIDGDAESRAEAAEFLGHLRNLFTLPILIRRLSDDSDPTVRYWLGFALGQMGTPEACAALNEAKKRETDPFAQRGIKDGLREAGCQPAHRPRYRKEVIEREIEHARLAVTLISTFERSLHETDCI